jgi:hypothetical protein
MPIFLGIILILHGLVHLLYAGQSTRAFALRPGMTWPDGSWVFSKLMSNRTIRWLAAIALTLAALGFIAAGLGAFFRTIWLYQAVIEAALLSTAIFVLFWDGKWQALPDKGGVGLLINLAVVVLSNLSL